MAEGIAQLALNFHPTHPITVAFDAPHISSDGGAVLLRQMDDRLGLVTLLKRYFAPGVTRLRKIWVDGGYEAQWLCDWVRGLKQTHKVDLEVVEHAGKGFHVVKHRWKVERTFGWLGNDRRHSRDYEVLTASSEAMIQISMIRRLLKRLA